MIGLILAVLGLEYLLLRGVHRPSSTRWLLFRRDPVIGFGRFWTRLGCFSSEAIALAGDLNQFRILQEPVEDGRGGRDVTDQVAPIFQLPDVRGPRNPPIHRQQCWLRLAPPRCWS